MARKHLVVALLLLSAGARSASADDQRLRCLFQRPLIVGASMSADYTAPDPGLLLAQRYGSEAGIIRRAVANRTSAQILPLVEGVDLSTASIVIALDLFFWDSHGGDCAAAESAVRIFVARVKAAGLPLVLGTIPPSGGACSPAVSGVIASVCAALPASCALTDLRALALQAEKDGGVDVEGQRVATKELYADRIHPSKIGAFVIAGEMNRSLEASAVKCPSPR